MATNNFIIPGEITTLTFLSDRPLEGVGKYGPYQAYKVRTEDGAEPLFYPPKYLHDDLASLGLTRGSVVKFLASPAETRDGRRYTRIEIVGTGAPRDITAPAPSSNQSPPPPSNRSDGSERNGILASVALKSATQTRGVGAEPTDVLATADVYLTWLRSA